MPSAGAFARKYALSCYTFEDDPEAHLVARLIHTHMKGRRVLDLGCGPVVPITSLFYPEAEEVVAVDRLKANLEVAQRPPPGMDEVVERALDYKYRYLAYGSDLGHGFVTTPRSIEYVQGDVTKKLGIGKFDSVMQIGCFAALDTADQFQAAVDNTRHYLKDGGTLLMMNWYAPKDNKRPYRFNGKVSQIVLELYRPALERAGYKIKEMHTTSKLSPDTKKLGYEKIIWAVAQK